MTCKYGIDTVLPVPSILNHVSSVRPKIVKKYIFHYVIGHIFMLVRYIIRFQCLYWREIVHADRCCRREPYGKRFQNPQSQAESESYCGQNVCMAGYLRELTNKAPGKQNTKTSCWLNSAQCAICTLYIQLLLVAYNMPFVSIRYYGNVALAKYGYVSTQ